MALGVNFMKQSLRALRCLDRKSRFFWLAIWIAVVTAHGSVVAQEQDSKREPASRSHGASTDEFHFRWLDPNKEVYVLQNRRYRKEGRGLISLLGGIGLSNPYRTTYNVEGRVGYFFSEAGGVEALVSGGFNQENTTIQSLARATSNVIPLIREVNTQVGGVVQWVPWYAKINVFNQILYFDWSFALGGGVLMADFNSTSDVNDPQVTSETLGAFYVGTGHQYHISDRFTVRLDFLGAFYRAKLDLDREDTAWFSNYNFNIGFGIRL